MLAKFCDALCFLFVAVRTSSSSWKLFNVHLVWTELSPPPHSSIAALPDNVMVFEDGSFGRSLGLGEVIRVGPPDGISALLRRNTREIVVSPP